MNDGAPEGESPLLTPAEECHLVICLSVRTVVKLDRTQPLTFSDNLTNWRTVETRSGMVVGWRPPSLA